MNKLSSIFFTSLLIILWCIILPACTMESSDPLPKAQKGVINLSDFDLSTKSIPLDGEWEFYWNALINPADFAAHNYSQQRVYVPVPVIWTRFEEVPDLPLTGYATYRLFINIGNEKILHAFKLNDLNTAYKIWVNGKVIGECGNVGTTKITMIPRYKTQSLVFAPEGPMLEIVIQVSNFHHDKAGIGKKIYFGTEQVIKAKRENSKGYDLFVIGALLVIGIYHLGLFILGKDEKSLLYFSAFCFLMSFRTLITSERVIIDFFPNFNWILLYKFDVITLYLAVPLFIIFLYYLFPKETNRTILIGEIILSTIWISITIFIDTLYISYSNNIYQIFLLLTLGYVIFVITKAWIHKHAGAGLLIIGIVIFNLTIVNDVLSSHLIIKTPFITQFGFLIFIFMQFAINKKFIAAEKERKKIEDKNKAILHAIPDSMYQIDSQGNILDYKNSEILFDTITSNNKNIEDIFPKVIYAKIIKMKKKLLKTDNTQIAVVKLTVGDTTRFVELRMVRSEQAFALLIIRDITDKKEAELRAKIHQEQVIQAEKLAALGTLVAGVAHEINNPNNAIMVTAGTLEKAFRNLAAILDEYEEEHEELYVGFVPYSLVKEDIQNAFPRIIKSSQRIKLIVEDLKKFARKEETDFYEMININDVVESAVRLLNNSINTATNNFTVTLDKDIPLIKANFQRLEQVIINLIQNACHALIDKSKAITVTTNIDPLKETIMINIEDEGKGMTEDTMKRIFDPFYTTKKDEGGTGLGLSVSNGIIKEYGGKIAFTSTINIGSKATVVLPINPIHNSTKNGGHNV